MRRVFCALLLELQELDPESVDKRLGQMHSFYKSGQWI